VFADYIAEGLYSAANAQAIREKAAVLPHRGRHDRIRLDPASSAQTGIGPSAFGEFARILGERVTARAPGGSVLDGLDLIEILLETDCLWIHPRCVHLIAAFRNYARAVRGGEIQNAPADDQSPWEDSLDALRYGIRDRFPEGRVGPSHFKSVRPGSLI
jgi:hypothetical protein